MAGKSRKKNVRWKNNPIFNNLVEFINKGYIFLFRDQKDNVYAEITRKNPKGEVNKIVCSIDSEDFKGTLLALVAVHTGEDLTNMRHYIAVCRHIAKNSPCIRNLFVRTAKFKESDSKDDYTIFIDLDGKEYIEINSGKWKITDTVRGFMFKSFPHQKPMVKPVKKGGDCTKLLDFLNIHDKKEQSILLSYIITGLIPEITMPALILNGPPGSAKTTLLRMVKKLLDPSVPEMINDNQWLNELSLIASQNRMIVLDNLTYLTSKQSDMLCSVITGVGFSKRRLYTDEELVVQEYKNLIALSGVRLVPDRADLFDRSIILSLDSIDPRDLKYEEDLWSKFNSTAGKIFGGMLDVLAEALIMVKRVKLHYKPRMADFARYSVAIMHTLGWDPQLIMEALMENKRKQIEAIIEASPIGLLLLRLLQDKDSWSGLASELNAELQKIAEGDGLHINYRYWPYSEKALKGELAFLSSALKEYGILFEEKRVSAGSLKRFHKIPSGLMIEPNENVDEILFEIGS